VTLRGAVLTLAGIGIGVGLGALIAGAIPLAFICLFWSSLLLAGTLFERTRYKSVTPQAPDSRWERTAERFIDDKTGQPVTVYVNPASGERRYVQE
jgi:hypothetical protein